MKQNKRTFDILNDIMNKRNRIETEKNEEEENLKEEISFLEDLGLEEDEAEVQLEDYEIDNAIYQAVANGAGA